MKKIVAAIDFSPNYKKTIRFAIQLASQIKAEIVFLHVVALIPPCAFCKTRQDLV